MHLSTSARIFMGVSTLILALLWATDVINEKPVLLLGMGINAIIFLAEPVKNGVLATLQFFKELALVVFEFIRVFWMNLRDKYHQRQMEKFENSWEWTIIKRVIDSHETEKPDTSVDAQLKNMASEIAGLEEDLEERDSDIDRNRNRIREQGEEFQESINTLEQFIEEAKESIEENSADLRGVAREFTKHEERIDELKEKVEALETQSEEVYSMLSDSPNKAEFDVLSENLEEAETDIDKLAERVRQLEENAPSTKPPHRRVLVPKTYYNQEYKHCELIIEEQGVYTFQFCDFFNVKFVIASEAAGFRFNYSRGMQVLFSERETMQRHTALEFKRSDFSITRINFLQFVRVTLNGSVVRDHGFHGMQCAVSLEENSSLYTTGTTEKPQLLLKHCKNSEVFAAGGQITIGENSVGSTYRHFD